MACAPRPREKHRPNRQRTAHLDLPAGAVDGDRRSLQRRTQEVRPTPDPRCRTAAARRCSSSGRRPRERRRPARNPAHIDPLRPSSSRKGSEDRAAGPRRSLAPNRGADRAKPRAVFPQIGGEQATPYTLFVDVKTSGGGLGQARIASSTFNVPRALTSKSENGSSMLQVTATCAAKMIHLVAPDGLTDPIEIAHIGDLPRRCGSHADCEATRCCPPRARVRAIEQQHMATPRASRSARLAPINPAPPVIKT